MNPRGATILPGRGRRFLRLHPQSLQFDLSTSNLASGLAQVGRAWVSWLLTYPF